MDSQIRQLEKKLLQRDKDLKSSLDESRIARKIELSRLQGIHDQVSDSDIVTQVSVHDTFHLYLVHIE